MSQDSITLQRATEDTLDRVERLLERNDLPTQDVRAGPGRFFLADADGSLVGVGSVEMYGSDGLLRSLVVGEPHRGEGYGAELCDALEDEARESGGETLYLLTTTAAAFFERRGYDEIERAAVAPSVREMTQFTELCPASATCMQKPIR
ncbi:MAG: amino-acid N-acetyltransferase [Natronomonas sp.]|jgi:amino-acid N-acetyltransferase|uniref:arsenic resistance N-acetyltransferase ArsN2 n=1 Tax=Natronomonas sp. TaxID=2184060 RepID=UPI003989F34E